MHFPKLVLKLSLAGTTALFALTASASAVTGGAQAEPACNQQAPISMFAKTAAKSATSHGAVNEAVTDVSSSKARKGQR
ncbi:MAG: hypothetical protein EOP06_05990 [Proteobacteria bacterium]|nr:MAG: hypothetical protein EOP06_05990 [Pseudomonadota bacterium]